MKLELSINENEINSVKCALEWMNNRLLFIEKVRKFDINALRAHICLLIAYGNERKIGENVTILNCDDLLRSIKFIENSVIPSSTIIYIIDILHIYAHYGLWTENNWQTLEAITITALNEQKELSIELLLRLHSRLNGIEKISPICLNALINYVHNIDVNNKLSIEILILLEQITKINQEKSVEIVSIIHDQITKCLKSKQLCDNCLTMLSYFIEHFLQNSVIIFLNELLQEGTTSAIIAHRKQSNYILKKLLKTAIEKNDLKSFINPVINQQNEIDEIENVWETYFVVLESLIEIQSHLITSTLNQYIDKICKFIPLYWTKSIFILVLQQNSISAVKYGIKYLIDNNIKIIDELKLSNCFFNALNVTALYIDDDYGFYDKLGKFLCDNLRIKTNLISNIQWKKIPAYILLKSWQNALNANDMKPLDHDAVNFITNCTKILSINLNEIIDLDEMIANALSMIDVQQIDIVKLLEIYEILPTKKILKIIVKNLSFIELTTIILTTTITPSIKVNYLTETNPNYDDLLDKMDIIFDERNDLLAPYHFDYYYIIFDIMLRTQTLFEAVNLFKLRSYTILLEHQTLKSVFVNIFKMLYTITVNYMPIYRKQNDHELEITYKALHEMFEYLVKKIRGPNSVLRLDRINDAIVDDWITVLNGEFSSSIEFFFSQQDISENIIAAIEHDDFDLNLVDILHFFFSFLS